MHTYSTKRLKTSLAERKVRHAVHLLAALQQNMRLTRSLATRQSKQLNSKKMRTCSHVVMTTVHEDEGASGRSLGPSRLSSIEDAFTGEEEIPILAYDNMVDHIGGVFVTNTRAPKTTKRSFGSTQQSPVVAKTSLTARHPDVGKAHTSRCRDMRSVFPRTGDC